jgi:hypothetical protein
VTDGMSARGSAVGWGAMAWVSVALAAVVAKAEADSVIGEATPTGQYSTSTVYGPGQLIKPLTVPTGTFNAWTQASHQFSDLWLWLTVQAGFDVVFVAGYLGLSMALIAGAETGIRPGLTPWLQRWWPLVALAAVNLVQAGLSVVAFMGWIRPHHNVPLALAVCLQVIVIAKWLLTVVFVAVLAYRLADDRNVRLQLLRIAVALKKQRFSLIIVALLTVVAIARGMDVLEQMPDVQRAWITWPPSLGWAHLAFAVAVQVLLAGLLALLSALRAQRARDALTPGDERDTPGYRPWVLTALALPVLAVIMRYTGLAAISWYNLIPIPALAAIVVIASLFSRHVHQQDTSAIPDPATKPNLAAALADRQRSDVTVRTTGDMLAVAVITVTGLGLVRSFTAAALVVGRPYSWAFGVAVVAGFAVAALSWVAARAWLQGRADFFDRTYDSVGLARPALTMRGEGSPGQPRVAGPGEQPAASPGEQPAAGPGEQPAPGPGEQPAPGPGEQPAASPGEQQTESNSERGSTAGVIPHSPARRLALFAIPFAVADVLLVFVPMWTTHWLGVLATTVIALGTLAVGLAVLAYLAQSRQPLPVFRLLRLKSTPVISLILIAALAGAVFSRTSHLHDIRLPPAVAAAARAGTDPASSTQAASTHAASAQTASSQTSSSQTSSSQAATTQAASTQAASTQAASTPALADSLQQWLRDPATASCAVPVTAGPAGGTASTAASDLRVEPMVLVAAAGGGIRAAWWTVKSLEQLAATPCGRHAVFAASGVSGGSVGLAIMDTTPARDRDSALAKVAGPDGLAAAIDGMLLRDTVAGLTGLNFKAAGLPAGQRFPDRAGLLEQAWQNEDRWLADPFPSVPSAPPVLPWRMLFNSTAVSTGCRAIIADRLIAPAGPVTSGLTCDLNSAAPIPDSYDFFAHLPCLRGLDAVTAALLSARFPYVTPSGVVNGCGSKSGSQVEQYVDGGYADSTGLATLAGLAPQLMSAVRQYNENALAGTAAGQPITLVVPVTVYLGNSPQPEPVMGVTASSPPQPLVPVSSGAASAQGQLSGSTSLLQQVSEATSASQWLACPATDQMCAQGRAAAAATVRQQLILVVPREFPTVTTPLGWVLSAASRSALSSGVATEAAGTCPDPARNQPYCPAGVGRLGDLLKLIGGRAGPGA